MTWQEAMRGVRPWPGAWVLDGLGDVVLCTREGQDFRVMLEHGYSEHGVVYLPDPDTRAAFDRRLALRLGAPAEAVDEGVVVRLSCGVVDVYAGLREVGDDREGWSVEPRWSSRSIPVDTDDPLLARALAWRSVA